MAYVNLKGMLADAREKNYAVGAFNIVNHLTASAAIRAAEEARSPIILQTSTSTVRAFGAGALMDFLGPLARRAKVPVAIHLDHCTDPAMAMQCIESGWSSIMIDASSLPLSENIRITREVRDYAESKNVTVEGELGAIAGVEDEIAVGDGSSSIADPWESILYCKATGIHAFAPAIGTAHGVYKGKPTLRFDILSSIREQAPCPIVIHGGTGLEDEDYRRLVAAGASKINISTAIKLSYMGAMEEFFGEKSEPKEPLILDGFAGGRVAETVRHYITAFGSRGRAS
ncbi:MAG: class II fructose-bisphosphate aldolase [Rectinemataceae bacterium]